VSRTRSFEERRIDRLVERDLRDPPFKHRLAAAKDPGRERDLHAVDRPVIAELLLNQRPLGAARELSVS